MFCDLSTTTAGYIKCICLSEPLECAKIHLSQLASMRWRECHYRGRDQSNDKNIGLISMALPLLNGSLLKGTGHRKPWHRSRPGESVDQKKHAKFFWEKSKSTELFRWTLKSIKAFFLGYIYLYR